MNQSRWLVVALLFIAVFLPRLASLGTILTIDEPLWLSRGAQFMQAVATGHTTKTIVAYQPGITTSWLVGLASRFNSLAAAQGVIAVASGILILICTYFLTLILSWRWGMIAGFLLALDPFLLAHSRVAHTDALLSLFMLSSILALLITPLRPRYVIFSGVFAGLAILTKFFGLVTPTFALLLLFFQPLSLKIKAKYFAIWLASCILTVFLLWPALWLHTSTVFTYITSGIAPHADAREGQTTAQWWYYTREAAFRLTPMTSLLALLGLASWKFLSNKRVLSLLLVCGLVYAVLMSLKGEKSDRYILFSLLILDIVAVWGLSFLSRWRWGKLVPIIVIAWLTFNAWQIHPYYLAYHNQLYPIEPTHKLGWGEGLEQAAKWVAQQDPTAPVASYYARVFEYFYTGHGSVDSLTHAADKPGAYVVLYRGMFERAADSPESELLAAYAAKQPVKIITINNLPYVWVYKND